MSGKSDGGNVTVTEESWFCVGKRRDICCPSADVRADVTREGRCQRGRAKEKADTVGRAGKVSLDDSHLVSKVANRLSA